MESYVCGKCYEGQNEIVEWVSLEEGATACAKVLWQVGTGVFQELKGLCSWPSE